MKETSGGDYLGYSQLRIVIAPCGKIHESTSFSRDRRIFFRDIHDSQPSLTTPSSTKLIRQVRMGLWCSQDVRWTGMHRKVERFPSAHPRKLAVSISGLVSVPLFWSRDWVVLPKENQDYLLARIFWELPLQTLSAWWSCILRCMLGPSTEERLRCHVYLSGPTKQKVPHLGSCSPQLGPKLDKHPLGISKISIWKSIIFRLQVPCFGDACGLKGSPTSDPLMISSMVHVVYINSEMLLELMFGKLSWLIP